MSEDSSKTLDGRRLWNRTHVTWGRRFPAERNVTLRADKRRALVLLIDLVVENSTVVESCGDVTTLGAAT